MGSIIQTNNVQTTQITSSEASVAVHYICLLELNIDVRDLSATLSSAHAYLISSPPY